VGTLVEELRVELRVRLAKEVLSVSELTAAASISWLFNGGVFAVLSFAEGGTKVMDIRLRLGRVQRGGIGGGCDICGALVSVGSVGVQLPA